LSRRIFAAATESLFSAPGNSAAAWSGVEVWTLAGKIVARKTCAQLPA
jgi:hypothetical protein